MDPISSDNTPGSASQGTEADQKGGKEPAKEHAERDFEDSPKEDGE
jgi:hypothetical protein